MRDEGVASVMRHELCIRLDLNPHPFDIGGDVVGVDGGDDREIGLVGTDTRGHDGAGAVRGVSGRNGVGGVDPLTKEDGFVEIRVI
jgi:hypothetical protein